jgi:hypothetical protein
MEQVRATYDLIATLGKIEVYRLKR